MRWLCLPSENLGHDWFIKSQQIDSILTEEGFDLSEEMTYLHFSESPDKVLDGQGQSLIARPVIGPNKMVAPPLVLIDWKAAPVWQEQLQGETLHELLVFAQKAKLKAMLTTATLVDPFSFRVHRKLGPGLFLSVEVIFHE